LNGYGAKLPDGVQCGARTLLPFPGHRAPVANGMACPHHDAMRIVATSNDPVRLSFLMVLLADAGIEAVLLDLHTSIIEGSIGAIQRRLAVPSDDYTRARRVLAEAGET